MDDENKTWDEPWGKYEVPVDPMDALQCDSCQRVETRKPLIGSEACVLQ